jgi:exodeoxyribonuclease V alpha subunit
VKGVRAKHYVLVGDPDQLPPIGPGKPFRDILGANILPTARLTKNWRTDCQGIRDLCAGMMTLDAEELAQEFPDYVKAGGVEFVRCEWNKSATNAAMIVARLVDEGVSLDQIAIIGPHKDGDAGCVAANLAVRAKLGFDPNAIVKGELLLVGRNNYHTPSTDDPEQVETVYNGERNLVAKRGSDCLDLKFPRNSEGLTRRVTLPMSDPDGDASAQLPEDFLFGYGMSTHKAQGSQFDFVIVMAERGFRGHGVSQGSNFYTAVSRARKKVFIVGKLADFAHGATTEETRRDTLLKILLGKGA